MNSWQRAYLAGVLDSDGSIVLQFRKREDVRFKYRPKTTVVFYQKEKHRKVIEEFKEMIGFGYVYTRNDGMTELRIEGHQRVKTIVTWLLPYLRFKKFQARQMLKSIKILQSKNYSIKGLLSVVKIADNISKANNAPRQRKHNFKSIKADLLNRGLISL